MAKTLTVLGIETSCDETAAAVLRGFPGAQPEILSNLILSQIDEHSAYGGVVPEIAARSHVQNLDGLIRAAMEEAQVNFSALDAVAATAGPGLLGGVIVGLMAGKAIALSGDLPFVAVNHLEGHALSPRITEPLAFPYLLLLVSGGHCQLLEVKGPGDYRRYGSTVDDAVGEAYDKTAKMLGLPYPGGPAIERVALQGDPQRFAFPRPFLGRDHLDFSFSGLKTAVARQAAEIENPTEKDVADIAASFQAAVGDVLCDRTERAMQRFSDENLGAGRFVVAGGVAANKALRSRLGEIANKCNYTLTCPPTALCTDNAAMIAWAGIERRAVGANDDLAVAPRARWPLTA
jgi:N6-L-threonylcarbamoyladenine synthase